MMGRQPISEFRKKTVSFRWPTEKEIDDLNLQPNTLVAVDLEKGEVCAQVSADDIFDHHGMRFYLDA